MNTRATLTLAALGLLAAVGGADAGQIGVASAVTNDVQGFEGGSPRPLSVGSGVFANERVKTGTASGAQLMFVDKTTVSIGPQAEITLDKFIYDPNKGAGQVVIDTVRGSFRFITGAQNPSRYAIKTPVGTLGIRGTIVNILVQNDYTIVGLSEGMARFQLGNGQVLELNQIGMAYKVDRAGNVSGPFPFNIADNQFGGLGWTFAGDPLGLHLDGIDQIRPVEQEVYYYGLSNHGNW